jgi:amino acid permease
MTKTQVGLGVLAIPASFDQLGLIPGMISLIVVALLTGWAAHVVGTFKQRHPEVYGLDDAARLMFHRVGYEVFSIVFIVCE